MQQRVQYSSVSPYKQHHRSLYTKVSHPDIKSSRFARELSYLLLSFLVVDNLPWTWRRDDVLMRRDWDGNEKGAGGKVLLGCFSLEALVVVVSKSGVVV